MGTIRDQKGRYSRDPYDAFLPRTSIKEVSANYTLVGSDFVLLVDAVGGAITITLPAVADLAGQEYVIKKIDASANAVTVDGAGAETIDGAATQALANEFDSFRIVCDGTEWWITGHMD